MEKCKKKCVNLTILKGKILQFLNGKSLVFKCNIDASFSNSPNMMNKRRLKDCYLSTLETLMFELAKTQNQ